jgi:hypothetical protein
MGDASDTWIGGVRLPAHPEPSIAEDRMINALLRHAEAQVSHRLMTPSTGIDAGAFHGRAPRPPRSARSRRGAPRPLSASALVAGLAAVHQALERRKAQQTAVKRFAEPSSVAPQARLELATR